MTKEENKNTVEKKEQPITIGKEDLDLLSSTLMRIEEAAGLVAKCKALGHMLAQSACATPQTEGIVHEDEMYSIGNIVLDFSDEAKDILTEVYHDIKDILSKTEEK